MGFSDYFFHLCGFVAPAFALALVMPLAARLVLPKGAIVARYWAQAAIAFAAGTAVLMLGLWYFGRDGKMATYVVLVGVVGSVQWLVGAGWRR
jgi:hypothetical protein